MGKSRHDRSLRDNRFPFCSFRTARIIDLGWPCADGRCMGWNGIVYYEAAGDAMITTIWTGASSWTLTALPLFIWMGEILYRTRLSQDMFRGLTPWMRWLPGGLLHTNIAGCTIFAAVSGSSAATLTTVGKMSIPELRARGYPEYMIIGTLAGAATLGLMIPPSLTLIVYGVSINESIIELFMAGIIPGLVLAALFASYIIGCDFFRLMSVQKMNPL